MLSPETFLHIVMFAGGCGWLYWVGRDFRRYWSELLGSNARVGRLPSAIILGVSAYAVLWMLGFLFDMFVRPFLG